jgi:hypothetical protein
MQSFCARLCPLDCNLLSLFGLTILSGRPTRTVAAACGRNLKLSIQICNQIKTDFFQVCPDPSSDFGSSQLEKSSQLDSLPLPQHTLSPPPPSSDIS